MACGSYEFALQIKSQASAILVFLFFPTDISDAICKFSFSSATYAKSRQ